MGFFQQTRGSLGMCQRSPRKKRQEGCGRVGEGSESWVADCPPARIH